MAAASQGRALVQALLSVLRDGDIARLDAILTHDCADADAMAGQLSGRAGFAQKVLWFRVMVPDARIELERVDATETGARAAWTTHAKSFGGALRYEGDFTIRDGLICATRITRRGPA